MNPEIVKRHVKDIREQAEMEDDERAHAREDNLYRDILSAIADGTIVDGQTCARLALTTRKLGFGRWCG